MQKAEIGKKGRLIKENILDNEAWGLFFCARKRPIDGVCDMKGVRLIESVCGVAVSKGHGAQNGGMVFLSDCEPEVFVVSADGLRGRGAMELGGCENRLRMRASKGL